MQVFDNKFETVNFYEDLSLFEAVWKKASENMVDQDYRNEIIKQFSFIATKKFKYVLFDTLDFYFTIMPETQLWNNEILSKNFNEAGVEKVAVVVTSDIFSEASVQQTIEDYAEVGFVTRYFESNDAARTWFLEK